jgi:hypothetical protein
MEDTNDHVDQGRSSLKLGQVTVSFDTGEHAEQAESETTSSTVTDQSTGKKGKNGKVKQKSSDSSENGKGKLFSFGQKKSKKGGPKTAAGW